MKLSTILRMALAALLLCIPASLQVSAQESTPAATTTAPKDTVDPAPPLAAKPVAFLKMPDISGTWRVHLWSPDGKTADVGDMEIRRVQLGSTDFLIEQPWIERDSKCFLQWSQSRQRFEGDLKDDDGRVENKITLQPRADNKSMRVITAPKNSSTKPAPKDRDPNQSQDDEVFTQDWIRTSRLRQARLPAGAVKYLAEHATGEASDSAVEVPPLPAELIAAVEAEEAEEPVDSLKPGRVGLQPATPLP